MQAFEEHWNNGMLSGSPTAFNFGTSPEETARFNWRAALEFVKSRIFEHEDALDIIEEELEEN